MALRTFLLAGSLVALSATVCAADSKAEVEAAVADISAAFLRTDATEVTGYYAEDAALLPPPDVTEEWVEGKESIEKFWTSIYEAISEVKAMPAEINASGDWAYELGDFTYLATEEGGQKTPGGGKYLHIWKKTPEGWQVYRDIWN